VNPDLAAGIAAVVLVVLIMFEVPIAFSLILSGISGLVLMGSASMITSTLGSVPYSATSKYALFVIPMYVLLGSLIANAGIGQAIYQAVNRIIGRIPGGLGATAVAATTLFSGISGSSAADVAAFGRISVDEMSRRGYQKEYAAAIVAAAGAFAALIPPAIIFVIYGVIADVNISALIFAGIVPGVISCVTLALFVVLTAVRTKKRSGAKFGGTGSSVPVSEPGISFAPQTGWHRAINSDFVGVVYAAVIFAIVVGGLYGGLFTATEAGAIGAVAAFLIMVVEVKKRRGSVRAVAAKSLRETVGVTGMIFFLVLGGSIFGYMLALSGLPRRLTDTVSSLDVPPVLIIAIMLLVLLPLGAVLDGLTTMLITVPLMAPIVLELGFDPIWFGVLFLKMTEIGLITPPVGINAFIISGATGAKPERVFRYLVPFVVLDLALTALYFVVPDIILWLPRIAEVH
jgi:tripartite ATP-independent transporter DctM subunit